MMEGCSQCATASALASGQGKPNHLILENEKAWASAADEWREGHCIVALKDHKISVSQMDPEETRLLFDLVVKVAGALEKKYGARKTYIVTVGDSNRFQHLHVHLLPKHRALPSYGVYAVQKMQEAEGLRKTSPEQQAALASDIKAIVAAS